MIRTKPSNLSKIMEISIEELQVLPFYDALIELHERYDECKLTDTQYATQMKICIAENPDYADILTRLMTNQLAHI